MLTRRMLRGVFVGRPAAWRNIRMQRYAAEVLNSAAPAMHTAEIDSESTRNPSGIAALLPYGDELIICAGGKRHY